MPLDQNTLASKLENMQPTDSEPAAIEAFVSAWSAYFAGSSASGAPVVPGAYEPGLAAMRTAMAGMSAADAGALAIQNGIAAFWGGIAGIPTTLWITAPVVLVPPIVPPAGIPGIAVALNGVFVTNTAGQLSLHDATVNIARVLHLNGGTGGSVPGSVPPAAPVAVFIL